MKTIRLTRFLGLGLAAVFFCGVASGQFVYRFDASADGDSPSSGFSSGSAIGVGSTVERSGSGAVVPQRSASLGSMAPPADGASGRGLFPAAWQPRVRPSSTAGSILKGLLSRLANTATGASAAASINGLSTHLCGWATATDKEHGTGFAQLPFMKSVCEVCDECVVEDPDLTRGLMLLIEFEGMEGLSNFVYQLQDRKIPALLLVSSGFVAANCADVRTLQDYGVEVGGVYSQDTFWDVPYEIQWAAMKETKEIIEACTGRPMRVFGSRYFAYDENTVRAAVDLGIPYVLARGTTGAKATIYRPQEYNVKIFSVSNVASENWGTGSLCDYSYWAREGTAEQFGGELFKALEHDKISPVSHTYIGGMKAAWNAEYLAFFDSGKVRWQNLDTFGNVDMIMPFSQIPDNREVQYTVPNPLVPLDDEPNVDNPCALDDFPLVPGSGGNVGEKIVVFHNGTGPMCIEFLAFIETINYPVEEHIVGEPGFWELLNALKAAFGGSQGVSTTFGFYPIIFIQNKAYSGFNDDIRNAIISLIAFPR